LAKIKDFVAIGRAFAGDHVHLIVAIEMALVVSPADLLASLQLLRDVGVAGGCEERRKPVEPGDDAVLDLAGRDLARPADDRRHAEAALHHGALALRERRLAAVRPREDLR